MGQFDFTTGVDATNQLAGLKVDAEDISFTLNEYTSAQTLSADNFLVMIDASTGGITLTLPAVNTTLPPTGIKNRIYTIKKIDSSQHTVTIDANSAETIDGEYTVDLKLQYSYVTIVCDGDEWFIIGGEYVKMEDTLEDIENILIDSLDRQEKALFILGKLEKHTDETNTVEIDDEVIEEALRDMMPEVVD